MKLNLNGTHRSIKLKVCCVVKTLQLFNCWWDQMNKWKLSLKKSMIKFERFLRIFLTFLDQLTHRKCQSLLFVTFWWCMLTQKHTLLKINIIENVTLTLCWSETATSDTNKELWWTKKIKVSMSIKITKSMTVNTYGVSSLDGINKLLSNQTPHSVLIEEELSQFQISHPLWIMIA